VYYSNYSYPAITFLLIKAVTICLNLTLAYYLRVALLDSA
jgi:hypothetical protein